MKRSTGAEETPRPPDAGERRYLVMGALLTLAFLFACSTWSLTTPAFHGPDEVKHVNSVGRLLAGGGWPLPYDAPVMGSTWQAAGEAEGSYAAAAPPSVRQAPKVAPDQRSRLDSPTSVPDSGRDQMVQHPPGYYAVAAGAVQLAGGTSLQWDAALVVMRITSALLTALAVPFLLGVARRISGSRRAAVVGTSAVLAIPFFMTVGGYVSNDSLLVLTVSATLYAGVRAVDSPRPLRWLTLTGLALGAALLTKGFALMLIPVVGLLGLLVLRGRHLSVPRALLLLVTPQAVAFVVGGWWWVRNLVVLGTIQASQCADGGCVKFAPDDPPPPDLWLFTTRFLDRFSRLFWGRGTRAAIAYPEPLTVVASICLLVVVAGALVLARRRLLLLVVLTPAVLIVATTFRNAYGIYVDVGVINRGVQGRYTYGAIAFVAVSVAVVWARLATRGRAAGPAAAVAVAGAAVLSALGWAWVFRRLYVGPRGGWRSGLFAASDALGTSPWLTAAEIGAFVACVAAVVLLLLAVPVRSYQARHVGPVSAD